MERAIRSRLAGLVLVIPLTLGGCATIADGIYRGLTTTSGKGRLHVYGGTVTDVHLIGISDTGNLAFPLIDLPFSFLADTVLLPITSVRAFVIAVIEARQRIRGAR